MNDEHPKRRRWFQFRLRTLLIVVLVLSFLLSKLAVRLEKARHNQRAYAEYCKQEAMLRSLGADMGVTVLLPPDNWLDRVVGDPGEYYIHSVGGRDTFNDDDLRRLKPLTRLEELDLNGTQVSDAGLDDTRSFANLKSLDLRDTNVTPEGVAELQEALPNCEIEY